MTLHTILKESNKLCKPPGTIKLFQNDHEYLSIDCVKGLSEVEGNSKEACMLFDAVLLNMPDCKDHVGSTGVWPEASLHYWQCVFQEISDQAV